MFTFPLKTTLTAVCVAGTALLTAPAQSTPFTTSTAGSSGLPNVTPSAITEVGYRSHKRGIRRGDRTYRRGLHHPRRHTWRRDYRKYPRYRYRRPGYDYYWNGFWYAVPLFLWATTYHRPYYDDYDLHVRSCLRRYRSYNPRTDRYRGYDGRLYRCRSRYRP